MTDIYILKIALMIRFFDIRPKEIKRPSGKEKISVTAKIDSDVSIPSPNFCNMTDVAISKFLLVKNQVILFRDNPVF